MQKYDLRWIFLLLVFANLVACSPKVEKKFLQSPKELAKLDEMPAPRGPISPCNDKLAYIPDAEQLEHTPMRFLRLNFHFLYDSLGRGNFPSDSARIFVENLLNEANAALDHGNQKMALPLGNDTPVLPPRYRYMLWPPLSAGEEAGIYFHYDEALYGMTNRGRYRNDYDQTVCKKYGIGKDSVLNVFAMAFPRDSLASPTFKKHFDPGIYIGGCVKIAGWYHIYTHLHPSATPEAPLHLREWHDLKCLNHEIGHALGLAHAWTRNDGCDDTPEHPNCFDLSDREKCGDVLSNNLMDYNPFQGAWTPCQIAAIQFGFAQIGSRTRKWLAPVWCDYDASQSIYIRDTIIWDSAKDLSGDLIIEDGGSLTLRCRLSLPKGGKIVVKPGGTLLLDGAVLENLCGDKWEGIEIWKKGNKSGKISMYNSPELKNMSHSFINTN
jgi:hypothetical protein